MKNLKTALHMYGPEYPSFIYHYNRFAFFNFAIPSDGNAPYYAYMVVSKNLEGEPAIIPPQCSATK